MAVVSRICTLVFTSGTGTRTWVATAATQDTAAGSSVVITTTQSSSGISPPVAPTALTLNLYDDDHNLIRAFTLTAASASQTSTFYFTNDGTSGGSARAGTVEIALRVQQTGGLGSTQYDYETDGSPSTLPSGFTAGTVDRGWIRGTTTATISVSNVSAGGAAPATWAYGDGVYHRIVLGAPLFVSRTLTH